MRDLAESNIKKVPKPSPGPTPDPFFVELKKAPPTKPTLKIIFKYNTILNKYESDYVIPQNSFPVSLTQIQNVLNNLRRVKFYDYEDTDAHMSTIWCEIGIICILLPVIGFFLAYLHYNRSNRRIAENRSERVSNIKKFFYEVNRQRGSHTQWVWKASTHAAWLELVFCQETLQNLTEGGSNSVFSRNLGNSRKISIKLEDCIQNNIEFCDDPRVRINTDENQGTIKNTTAVLVSPTITGNPRLGITTGMSRPRRRRGSVDINHMCPRKDSSYSIPENVVQEYLDSNYTGSVYTQSKKGSLWKIKRDSEIGVMVPETMNSRHGNEISEESDSSRSDLEIERDIKETRSPKKTRGTVNPNSLQPVLTQIKPKSRFSVHQTSNVNIGERNSISVKKISLDGSHNVSLSPNKQQKSDDYDKFDQKGFQIESSGNSIDGDLSPPKKKSIREILDFGNQARIVEEDVDEIVLNDFSPTDEKLVVSQPFESLDSPTGKNAIPVEISPGSEEKKMI
jgi:phosphate/sulfate permease